MRGPRFSLDPPPTPFAFLIVGVIPGTIAGGAKVGSSRRGRLSIVIVAPYAGRERA